MMLEMMLEIDSPPFYMARRNDFSPSKTLEK